MTCERCMYDAPYRWCCKPECGEHEFCRNCTANSRGSECPDDEVTEWLNRLLKKSDGLYIHLYD